MNDLAGAAQAAESAALPQRYAAVRAWTEHLAASLSDEDQCVQSMPDASPAKWHRAHTTWFFEQFVLTRVRCRAIRCSTATFAYLFNSYYEAVGPRHPRPSRGLLTRPSADRGRAHIAATSMRRCCGCWRACRTRPPASSSSACSTSSSIRSCCSPTCCMRSRRTRWRPRCCRTGGSRAARPAPTRFVDCAGGMVQHRASRRRLLLRQRDAGAFGLSAAVSAGIAPGAQQRVAGVHRRRRLSHARRCGCRMAGPVRRPNGWTAPLYWREMRWRLVADGIARPGAARSGRAGAPRQLVRGRCLRALGRRSAADRGGVGSCRRHRPISRELTGACLAVDGQRLQPISGVSAGRRRGRRVQRKVHDQPDGAARRFAGHAGGSHAAQLPELLPSRQALAVQRRSSGARRLTGKSDRCLMTPPRCRWRPAASRMRRCPACCSRARRCRRSCSTTRKAVGCSRRSPSCRNTI